MTQIEEKKATAQLNTWEGEFGKEYTDRNKIEWSKRAPSFAKMLEGLQLKNILEVGCNRGHNLVALSEIFKDALPGITGIEPNGYAIEIARKSSPLISVLKADAFNIPFKDGYFDLAFTAGVLIHISLKDLHRAMREIYRVSGKYILAVEYFAEEETEIQYRGSTDLLWKRNFLKHYQQLFPDLKLVKNGYWGENEGFDRTTWWLMEKTGHFSMNSKDLDLIVYDFDGVMTDNRVILSEDGKESVSANRSDGLGVGMIRQLNVPQIIISTETNSVVRKRAGKLNIEVINACKDKKKVLEDYCREKGYDLGKVVYVGNDLNDLEVMKTVGFPVAPSDAYPQILSVAKFITSAKGGHGVVRELSEYIK